MRKILSMLLALTMILSLFSVNVFAADEVVEYETIAVIAANGVSSKGDKFPGGGWPGTEGRMNYGSTAIDNKSTSPAEGLATWDEFVKAIKTEGARLVLKYTSEGGDGGFFNLFQLSIGDKDMHVGIANWESPNNQKLELTLNGEKADTNSIGKDGTHVISISIKDYADILAAHTCDDHEAGSVTIDDITAVKFQDGLGGDNVKLSDVSVYVEAPKSATTDPEPEPEDKPDTKILLEIGPDVWTLYRCETIDVAKSGTYKLTTKAEKTIDGNAEAAFVGLKSGRTIDGKENATALPNGTTITVKSVKMGDTAVTLAKGKETYTVKDGKLDFVLKLVGFGQNANIFDGTLPSAFTTVEVEFEVNNPDNPLPDKPVDPDPEPAEGDHPKGEKEIAVDGVEYPLNDGGAHTYAITGQELGKTVTVHLVGTTGGDFRVWLSHGDWDRMSEIKTVSYSSLEGGKFDVTYELTIADADNKNVDIASHVQIKAPSGGSLKDFTLTHLGIVYPAAEAVEHPEGEKEVEITDKTVSKLGANEVVIADGTVTSSANQFAILLPEAANVKDKITVHVKGTTTGDFRMWAGHEDGAYTMSPDPAWKASERGITVPTPDGEEFDFVYTLTVNDKDTVGCSEADCIIFKAPSYNENLKDLKITHFGYTIEKYYAEPAGYVEDATLTEATVEEADGNVVITPEGDVTTEGLLISLEEPAAADGKVTVSYGAEPRADGKTDDDGDGYIEEFAWSGEFLMHEWHNVKDIIGESSLSDFITAINLSGAVLEVSFENDSQYGNMTNVVFAWGGPSMSLGNYPVGKQTLKKPVADSGATPGSIAECIFQFDIYQHSEVDVKITGIKVYSPVPETPEDIVVEFKAGDMYIEVPTSAAKKSAIKSITIEPATAIGGKDNVAAVKVKKPKDETNALASLNGYAVQLGEDYHGFLFMGHMITMPHTFGEDNICTACDYERIVVEEGDSDKPAKPKLTTLDQGDACVIDISNLGLKSGDTVHISIAGTVNTSVSALRLFLATEGVFNNNASDIVNAELDGNSFTYEGDLTAQGNIMYIYIKSQAGGPALHPSNFDITVFTAEKK